MRKTAGRAWPTLLFSLVFLSFGILLFLFAEPSVTWVAELQKTDFGKLFGSWNAKQISSGISGLSMALLAVAGRAAWRFFGLLVDRTGSPQETVVSRDKPEPQVFEQSAITT